MGLNQAATATPSANSATAIAMIRGTGELRGEDNWPCGIHGVCPAGTLPNGAFDMARSYRRIVRAPFTRDQHPGERLVRAWAGPGAWNDLTNSGELTPSRCSVSLRRGLAPDRNGEFMQLPEPQPSTEDLQRASAAEHMEASLSANLARKLHVNPRELHLTAGQIDQHAEAFLTVHRTAQWRAGDAILGSGLAGAALAQMVAGWEGAGTRFGQAFLHYAEGHRGAADAYVHTDGESAQSISGTVEGL